MRPRPRRNGFSMIEMMIAIAILATIFAMIYMSFATTIETKFIVEDSNELYGMARLAMDRMSRELSMAFVRPIVRRGEADFTIFFGEDLESEGYPMDALHYTSVSHTKYGGAIRESDQNEVSYYVVDDEDLNRRVLMYREDTTIDEDNMAGGVQYVLCESLWGINFRYYDNEAEEWVDEWDSRLIESQTKKLPKAVEITLILRGPMDEELIFQTKVMVAR